MGFVESLKGLIYDILHNLDRINVDYITSNGLNPLRIRHDSGGLIEFKSDGKAYYNGGEIGAGSGGVTDHGALTGLEDDDHTQYYNSARHTKAIHDALNIDADTLNSKIALDFLWLDGSLTMAGDFDLNAELLMNNQIIRNCGGIYAPDNLDLDIGINNGVGVYNVKITIDDDGSKLFDELNINSQPLTNVTNIYSTDSSSSYTRFYNVNSGNTLKFEIDKSFNTSHQILDMDNNDIIHAYSLGGRTDAELVIESKYHALGLTAESGYQVDVFRELDVNSNKIVSLATPTADYDAATKKYVDDNVGAVDHGALTGLGDDDHTQYLLINGSRAMTGNLSMGANNVYLDSGILRISNGSTLSGSIGFTTGVQNFIQRQLYSGSDYTLLSDQDYMHTWAILGTEKMHLSTADGLKMYTGIDMNGQSITRASIAGTNSALFKINQNNAGVEASAIEFDRGSVATAARILWSEANDWFSFEDVTGSTKATIDAAKLQVTDAVNLDGQTGTVKISENDSTGDMEFQVAAGDSFVFKTV